MATVAAIGSMSQDHKERSKVSDEGGGAAASSVSRCYGRFCWTFYSRLYESRHSLRQIFNIFNINTFIKLDFMTNLSFS